MLATAEYVEPRLTTRAMLDPTRLCHLRCDFCYWLPDNSFHSVKPWPEQVKEVHDAVARGCDAADLTGGDPLTNPHVVDLVKLCVEQGISLRIISSLICKEPVLDAVLDAGVDDWLVSLHGAKPETHDAIVHVPRARSFQLRRMAKIAERTQWCANYVLIEKNQTELADFARMIVALPHKLPRILNFINYNPHYGAQKKMRDQAVANIADPRIFSPLLDEAIDILEDAGIGVNCRYLPMCFVAERHRKNVCSDLHVAFDQGEWINGIPGNTVADGEAYGRRLSQSNEVQTEPCASCGIKAMCGGANKIWHQLATEKFGREVLSPQPAPWFVSEPAYWHYRRENALGNDPRR